MKTLQQTFSEYFRLLQVLHLAMLTGPVMLGLVTHFVIQPTPLADSGLYINVSAGLLALNTVLAYWLYNQRLMAIKNSEHLHDKLQGYRSATILKCALIEGAALIALVFYLLRGNLIFLAIGGVGLLILLLNHPQVFKLKTELELSPAELARVDNPNEKVVSTTLR